MANVVQLRFIYCCTVFVMLSLVLNARATRSLSGYNSCSARCIELPVFMKSDAAPASMFVKYTGSYGCMNEDCPVFGKLGVGRKVPSGIPAPSASVPCGGEVEEMDNGCPDLFPGNQICISSYRPMQCCRSHADINLVLHGYALLPEHPPRA